MKTVDLLKTFKKSDRVFDICYGLGTVERVTEYVMTVRFDNIKYVMPYTQATALTLSFTKYTLQNFSQERPINYEDYIGKWGKFFDNEGDEDIVISRLTEFFKSEGVRYLTSYKAIYRFFEPLTEEQIKILGLE